MNQTTQTHISYKKNKKKYRFATQTKKKKKSDLQKAKKHRLAIHGSTKNPNLHDTSGDLEDFCVTRPSSKDLYKTYLDL